MCVPFHSIQLIIRWNAWFPWQLLFTFSINIHTQYTAHTMDIIGSYRSKFRIRCSLRSLQITTHSYTQPMRHTKSWHNLIRDLFNYKITAIEHFFFVRLVFVRVCMCVIALFSLLTFETLSLGTSCMYLCTAMAIGSPFALLILFLCSLFDWKHIVEFCPCDLYRRSSISFRNNHS